MHATTKLCSLKKKNFYSGSSSIWKSSSHENFACFCCIHKIEKFLSDSWKTKNFKVYKMNCWFKIMVFNHHTKLPSQFLFSPIFPLIFRTHTLKYIRYSAPNICFANVCEICVQMQPLQANSNFFIIMYINIYIRRAPKKRNSYSMVYDFSGAFWYIWLRLELFFPTLPCPCFANI